jgi:transposase
VSGAEELSRLWKAREVLYDIQGNRLRLRWLECVEVDKDGCWIWTGQHGGRNLAYPQFHAAGQNPAAAFSWFLKLWYPHGLRELTRGWRSRTCGKRSCVRPACASGLGRKGAPQGPRRDWTQARALYESGMSGAEVDRVLGFPKGSTGGAARRYRWGATKLTRAQSRARAVEGLAMIAAGATGRQVAQHFGVKVSCVRAWQRRARHLAPEEVRAQLDHRIEVRKARGRAGQSNDHLKERGEQMREMRRSGYNCTEIARRFGVTVRTASRQTKSVGGFVTPVAASQADLVPE